MPAPSTNPATPSPAETPPAPSPASPAPTPEPSPEASFTIADGLSSVSTVAASSDGRGYLVAFDAFRDHRHDIFAVRLDPDGARLDDEWITLSDRSAIGSYPDAGYDSPSASFDGTAYDVAWFGEQGLSPEFPLTGWAFVAMRIDPAGVVLEPAKEIESGAGSGVGPTLLPPPAVAAQDSDFVVLWSVLLGGGLGTLVEGARVAFGTGDFAVEDLGVIAPPMGSSDTRRLTAGPPAIATSGEATVGAWVEGELRRDGTSQPNGAVWVYALDGSSRTRTRVADVVAGDRFRTAIAGDGTDFLIVWEAATETAPGDVTEIRGARFRPGAGVLDGDDGFVIQAGVGRIRLGGVAYGPGGYLVTWIEPHGSVSGDRLRAVQVSPGGEVDRSAIFEVADDVGSPSAVGVTSNGRRFLVVFFRDDPRLSLVGTFLDPP
ncbi:MAG TPA: hypothetical protein VFC51_12130 [Chloroflexota bacterium]|nr:hypothetical protein [Chloroflexota bacterium]